MNEVTHHKKQQYTIRAMSCLKRMTSEIIELSQVAHEYHEEFGYQDYIQWVKDELNLGDRRGQQLLNVYEKFGATADSAVNKIGTETLYLLSAPSTPEAVKQEAIERLKEEQEIQSDSLRNTL